VYELKLITEIGLFLRTFFTWCVPFQTYFFCGGFPPSLATISKLEGCIEGKKNYNKRLQYLRYIHMYEMLAHHTSKQNQEAANVVELLPFGKCSTKFSQFLKGIHCSVC